MANFDTSGWSYTKKTQRKINKGKIQLGSDRSGFSNYLLQKYAQMGSDSLGNVSSGQISRGAAFSNTQLAQMEWDYQNTQEERAYNEAMYNKYQSPAAMMRQYQDAGINPALMYEGGVDVNGPSSSGSVAGATGTTGASETPTNGFEQVMKIIGSLMSVLTGSSQIVNTGFSIKNQNDSTAADVKEKTSRAANLDADTEGKKLDNAITQSFGMVNAALNNKVLQTQISKNLQDIAESVSRVDVNHKTIEVYGEQIQLMMTQEALNGAKSAMAKFDLSKAIEMLPLEKQLARASIALTNAQAVKTSEEASQVELTAVAERNKIYAEATLAAAKALNENAMLESGYYDALVQYHKDMGDAALANAYVNYKQLAINQQNADTAAKNAETNAKQLEINQQNADTKTAGTMLHYVFGALEMIGGVTLLSVPGAQPAGAALLGAGGSTLLLTE